jgi:hypothetical protein
MDSLVFPIRHELREIHLSQGSGLPKGPCVRRCSKAAPSFVPHNSQLTPPADVTLSILESRCDELPLARHFNPMAPSLYG